MATVFLPSEISKHTGDLESIAIDAPRVHELMLALTARFPGAAEALAQMAVAVDGEIYNDADYIEIGANSEIHLVPRISGGTSDDENSGLGIRNSGNRR
jgi:molybdopterin converting factor small subunit